MYPQRATGWTLVVTGSMGLAATGWLATRARDAETSVSPAVPASAESPSATAVPPDAAPLASGSRAGAEPEPPPANAVASPAPAPEGRHAAPEPEPAPPRHERSAVRGAPAAPAVAAPRAAPGATGETGAEPAAAATPAAPSYAALCGANDAVRAVAVNTTTAPAGLHCWLLLSDGRWRYRDALGRTSELGELEFVTLAGLPGRVLGGSQSAVQFFIPDNVADAPRGARWVRFRGAPDAPWLPMAPVRE